MKKTKKIKLEKINKKLNEVKNKKNKRTSNSNTKVEKLKLLCVIVHRNQANFYIDSFTNLGVSEVYDVFGEGTAPKDIDTIVGTNDSDKSLVMCLVKESLLNKCLEIINGRFLLSKQAKGIAFTIPIKSMVGVIMYRYLANKRGLK